MLSVIIPTCNRNAQLKLCLDLLAPGTQSLKGEHYEVIVSDDGRNNEARQMLEANYAWVRWIEGPKKGPAANRNSGAAYAHGDWLVFTDDDCLPDKHWLQAYQNAIANHPASKAFEGSILPDNPDLLKKDMAECPVNETGGCFWTANVMINRQLFQEIDGFDERFLMAANEDQVIYQKLQQQTTVPFLEDSIVQHPVKMIELLKKIKQLPVSEKSLILFRKTQHFSGFNNWIDGLRTHLLAGYQSLRRLKARRTCFHAIGTVYRFFWGPFLIQKIYRENRTG